MYTASLPAFKRLPTTSSTLAILFLISTGATLLIICLVMKAYALGTLSNLA